MPAAQDVLVRPITRPEIGRVAMFLNERMNSRLSSSDWAEAIVPPWPVTSPNHGFMLVQADVIVGVNLAFYSDRMVDGELVKFCNLAALCVREDARLHTFRLVRSLLRQPGYHFTDLSPSGSVVELDRRLGFDQIDTASVIVPNIPRPQRAFRVTAGRREIGEILEGKDAEIFSDHRFARAARHLLVRRGDEYCYVIFRKDRRKGLPLFASMLYVSHPELFAAAFGDIAAHLVAKHGALASLIERRVVDFRPFLGRVLTTPRPKMFKSAHLGERDIDYLYSELTCVPW